MGTVDSNKNLYLEVCVEFIERRFGKSLDFVAQTEHGYLNSGRVAPQDGGKVCKFDESTLTWFDCGQDSMYWNIEDDGRVLVGYPEDDQSEGVLCFNIGHPREAAELLHLFVQSSTRLVGDIPESRYFKLGKIADLFAVIPSGDGWRVLDLARLPKNMPDGFRTALALDLTQNRERLLDSHFRWPPPFEERWPDYVGMLPDAAPYLRAGYLVDPHCGLDLGLRLLNGTIDNSNPFLGILCVPSNDDVSALYLGEYFEYDLKLPMHIGAAFAQENDLETVCAMLTKTTICMPSDFTDQIKVAVQANLLRNRVIDQAKRLVYSRAPYRHFGVRYQAAGHALGRMVDACRSCMEAS